LLSGTPILTVSDPHSPLGLEVRNFNVGPWFCWEESCTVPAFLASMHARDEEFALWQSNAVRRSTYYNRERCLDLIESVLKELVYNRALAQTHAADMAKIWGALVPRTSGSSPAPNTFSS
jgi:hypothetical protein